MTDKAISPLRRRLIEDMGDCQEFRAGLGMMGTKEPTHAETQRADYS